MEQSKYGMISQTRSESEMSGVTSRSGRQHLSPTSQFSAQQSIRSPSVASNGNLKSPRNAEEVDLHDLAKGWKAAIARTEDPSTRHEAWVKNDRGNLPLHSAASFRAPKEVTEALLKVYPEAASLTNNYGNLALHFTAWKKGPLDVEKLLLEIFPEGAAQKNNHGNLPLHYAAHYNAPLEVVKALYDAYPEAAHQKNNDSNTPLDLAIADGASPNVVALLQGKRVPPSDEDVLEEAKSKVERIEKQLQKHMGKTVNSKDDLNAVLAFLMDIKEKHHHALYSAGIDPENVSDFGSLLEEVRKAGAEDANPDVFEEEDIESQRIEDALIPPDDEVEALLSKIIGLDPLKNHIRGLRRTLELGRKDPTQHKTVRHLSLIGSPGTGKTFAARNLMPILFKIGGVKRDYFLEVGRDDLVDGKSVKRTIEKTKRIIEKARGGIVFVDEAYTLLPSKARRKSKDHGAAALRELANALPRGDPFIIFAGYPEDSQFVLASDIGFKGNFLMQIEFPDPSPTDLARIFLSKVHSRGFIPGPGLTVQYLAELIKNNTDPDWRSERNGRLSEYLLLSVIAEIKKRTEGGSEMSSKTSSMPLPGSKLISQYSPDDIIVTVEDVHSGIMNGM